LQAVSRVRVAMMTSFNMGWAENTRGEAGSMSFTG
jgi:hypothetical protein